jgi:hypothetical protein
VDFCFWTIGRKIIGSKMKKDGKWWQKDYWQKDKEKGARTSVTERNRILVAERWLAEK